MIALCFLVLPCGHARTSYVCNSSFTHTGAYILLVWIILRGQCHTESEQGYTKIICIINSRTNVFFNSCGVWADKLNQFFVFKIHADFFFLAILCGNQCPGEML